MIYTENLDANIKHTMPSRIDAESCNKNTIWFKFIYFIKPLYKDKNQP